MSLVSWTSETSRPSVANPARAEARRRGRPCPITSPAVGLGQQRQDLAVVELGDRGRLLPLLADLVELALGAGPDQSRSSTQARAWISALTRKHLARDAVGVDPVDGVVAGR